jgi:type II secretory pathway pseudopilin PulG
MKHWPVLQQRRYFATFLVLLAVILAAASAIAQTQPPDPSPGISPEDINKYSGFMRQLSEVFKKIQDNVSFPSPRSQSHLLPLLPENTVFYAAFPNYGEASHQVLALFQDELKQNADLRTAWTQGEMATNGPKIENALEQFYQVSQFLGDEIVVSGAVEGEKDPTFVMIAEAQKPGLQDPLLQLAKSLAGKSTAPMRVLDVKELAVASSTGDAKTKATFKPTADQLLILVRPDFIIGALDLATLRSFNASLDRGGHDFGATPFGQRLAQAYESGATTVAGVDLQAILKRIPVIGLNSLQGTGFDDAKYLISVHNHVAGQAVSQMELSFTGPRRGVASWLAEPGPMPSLDFVSPKAVMVASFLLKNPAHIYDEFKQLATASKPNALAGITNMEALLKLSLKDDLFSHLGGEITLELDHLAQAEPAVWKVILKTKDADALQATLNALMAAAKINSQPSEEDGVTYRSITIPSGPKTIEIGFAFVDGYLVVASSRELVKEAVQLHRTGESLAKSQPFLAAQLPGNLAEVSALVFEDPVAMLLSMRQKSAEMASLFHSTPAVIAGYGDEGAIREASRSGGIDMGAGMVIAAIAIPNLLRARSAANESSAVATVREANAAQLTYSTTYPQKGFARDLATLGPDQNGSARSSPQHAGLIDASLGKEICTADSWCEKSGFSFRIATTCGPGPCRNYVLVATPVTGSTGSRTFCSTSDAVIRAKNEVSLTAPLSAAECLKWTPLQ